MNAAAALEKQIDRYRQMTGEQRLAIALELHGLSCDVAREGIRRANPGADTAEVSDCCIAASTWLALDE
ncbi:MAG: hypothetical protein DMF44_10030 [Verrucomicrobia bacterium]|nr:MAG: hypothetical protein DMF44_10030 [Verrucomicrobiota bacterium]